MLLKEMPQGMRFMFEDRSTPLAVAGVTRGQHSAAGEFTYLGVGEDTCPKLLHEKSGKEIKVVPGTYYRHVLKL